MNDAAEVKEKKSPQVWWRVEADYGGGFVLVGETYDRIGYLALADRARDDKALKVRVIRCEAVGGDNE